MVNRTKPVGCMAITLSLFRLRAGAFILIFATTGCIRTEVCQAGGTARVRAGHQSADGVLWAGETIKIALIE